MTAERAQDAPSCLAFELPSLGPTGQVLRGWFIREDLPRCGAQVRGAEAFSQFQLLSPAAPGPAPRPVQPPAGSPPPRPPSRTFLLPAHPALPTGRILSGGCPAEGLRGTLPPKGGVGQESGRSWRPGWSRKPAKPSPPLRALPPGPGGTPGRRGGWG